MKIENKKGEVFNVLLDLDQVERVKNFPYSWIANYQGDNDSYYICSTIYLGTEDEKPQYTSIQLTRFLLNIEQKTKVVVDHINHNTLDNRLNNQRILPYQKNSLNRKGANSNNKTGYRNVSYIKSTGKYVFQLQINRKNTRLGEFDDVHEAGKFAEKMREKYYKPKFESK